MEKGFKEYFKGKVSRLPNNNGFLISNLNGLSTWREIILANRKYRNSSSPTTDLFSTSQLIYHATAYFKNNQFENALQLYKKLLTKLPTDDTQYPVCLHNIASCHKRLEQYEPALDYFKRARDCYKSGLHEHFEKYEKECVNVLNMENTVGM